MFQVTRSIDISFSHHIRGHEGPCINIHGHTWKFEVTFGSETLDETGFVIDFSEINQKVLFPCHRLLDHSFAVGEATFNEIKEPLESVGQKLLASRGTQLTSTSHTSSLESKEYLGAKNVYAGGLKVALFPFSPTSERLAKWLFDISEHAASDSEKIQVIEAKVYETLHPVASVATYKNT